MSSLLTDAEKNAYSSVLLDLADTFKQTIQIYKTPTKTAITTANHFNSIFGSDQPAMSLTEVVNSGEYYARVYFLDFQQGNTSNTNMFPLNDARFKEARSVVKLRVDADVYLQLKDCEKVTFNTGVFTVIPYTKPHGLFNVQFYDIWLVGLD